MKKIKLLLLFSIGLTFISCSSDDSSDSKNDISIVGKWKIMSETVDDVTTVYGNCGGDILYLKEDQSFEDYGFFENNSVCEIDGKDDGSWNKEENILVLKFTESENIEDENWTIINLTDSELVMIEESIEGEKVTRNYRKQ